MRDAIAIGLGVVAFVAGYVWLAFKFRKDLSDDTTHHPHYWDY